MSRKLLIIQVAALGHDLLARNDCLRIGGIDLAPLQSVFPAVTCSVQASFRTGLYPDDHGMVANGHYHGRLAKVLFWEQSARLIEGRRIWEGLRSRGRRVGMLFWQQSLGETVDLVLSPAPIHKHHGGMIQDCYAQPPGLYQHLIDGIGRPFKLQQYWGPLASARVGDWIADATARVMAGPHATDLLLAYLPSLDYDLQRHGPESAAAAKALAATRGQLERMLTAAADRGYEVVVFGDYAIAPASGEAVFPNRALAEAGLFATRSVRGMQYPDFYRCRAFAVVDHEVALVHVRREDDLPAARACLRELDGVADVLMGDDLRRSRLEHPHAGQMVAIAEPGRWLAYPWWRRRREAPDYASHIDIHNKPGFDPCELLFGWPPMSVSQNTARIAGTHGRAGPDRPVAWGSTLDLRPDGDDLVSLARAVQQYLENL